MGDLHLNYRNRTKSPNGLTDSRPVSTNTSGDDSGQVLEALHPTSLATSTVQLPSGGRVHQRRGQGYLDAGPRMFPQDQGPFPGPDESQVPKMPQLRDIARLSGRIGTMWTVIGAIVIFVVGIIVGMVLGFLAFAPDKNGSFK